MNIKKIKDLGLIAVLITLGYSPLEKVKEGKEVFYLFESDEELENLCNDYMNNRLDIDARSYSLILKTVKSDIYELKNK